MRRIFVLILFSASCPAWAFPAPDIVINLFGSGAQLIGMLAASVGAAWFGIGKSRNSKAQDGFRLGFMLLCGLLVCSLVGNVWQYWRQAEQQARRLQTNLLRASPPTHPIQQRLALDRDEFNHWLMEGRPYNLIDVREPEEFEMGYIPGAHHSRYADLLGPAHSLLRHDVPNVLICDSGFRSGEICSQLDAQGLPCRFVAGGYAKWVMEGRPMAGVAADRGVSLQSLPRYRRDSVLIDTPEVDQLVRQAKAQIIDVRTPAEFKQNHLPNAINLPLREQTSDQLAQAFAGLPHVPIIAACYDNRSCFYSKVIGLRLTRIGTDFRGRYTVPHEYPIPVQLDRGLVLRKLNGLLDQALGWLSRPPYILLEAMRQRTDSLAPGILLLSVLARLLCAPATLLVERSRWRLRRLEEASRNRLGSAHALEKKREWHRLLKREGIRPGRDFLLGLFQLVLLVGCLAAVSDIAGQSAMMDSAQAFWAEPDPRHLLPVLVAVAIGCYISVSAQPGTDFLAGQGAPREISSRRWWQWTLIAVVAASMGYWADAMSMATALYLLASLILLLVQRWFMRFLWRSSNAEVEQGISNRAVLPLADSMRLRGAGAKAISLAHLKRNGLPVPNGFVVTVDAWLGQGAVSKLVVQRQVRAAFHRLTLFGLMPSALAVRRAAGDEDGSDSSQAGRYLTLLNIDDAGLNAAIDAVCNACSAGRNDVGGAAGCVIVQAMVDAEYAGVLFTEAPDNSGAMLIELAAGVGAVVAGRDAPRIFRIGWGSGLVIDSAEPPITLGPLWALARRVEALFGRPQDIEWAYRKGRYYLLQARPITRRVVDDGSVRALREQERRRLIELVWRSGAKANDDGLVVDDLAVEMPHASPLSLSLTEALRGQGGATETAWRRLGFDYLEEAAPRWQTAFGRTHVIQCAGGHKRLQPGWIAQLRFSRRVDLLTGALERDFLPSFRQAMRLRRALDLSRLNTSELLALFQIWTDEFVHQTYAEVEAINLAASVYDRSARVLLNRRGLDPAIFLRPDRALPNLRAMKQLIKVRDTQATMTEFMAEFGHRAAHDFELSEQRYAERLEWLMRWKDSLPADLPDPMPLPSLPHGRSLATAVERAQRYLMLKEEVKHECAMALASLRRILLELDSRLALSGAIFNFTLDELKMLTLPLSTEVRRMLSARAEMHAAFLGFDVPNRLSMCALERLDLDGGCDVSLPSDGELSGIRVAGAGRVSGVVCVLHNPSEIDAFRKGSILVTPTADPAWVTLFPLAAAVVCETGGWLCHAAIMARELSLPAIFGVSGALSLLRDGDRVMLDENGRITVIPIQ